MVVNLDRERRRLVDPAAGGVENRPGDPDHVELAEQGVGQLQDPVAQRVAAARRLGRDQAALLERPHQPEGGRDAQLGPRGQLGERLRALGLSKRLQQAHRPLHRPNPVRFLFHGMKSRFHRTATR